MRDAENIGTQQVSISILVPTAKNQSSCVFDPLHPVRTAQKGPCRGRVAPVCRFQEGGRVTAPDTPILGRVPSVRLALLQAVLGRSILVLG